MKKNRATLKDYFKKGAIPTDAQFADLIDSMLNQEEDNINKLPNAPLSITATGTDESLVNFYRLEQNDPTLSWQFKQKPDGKTGLTISDAAAPRLFIQSGTGNVGIGTTTPGAKLQVLGSQERVSLRVGAGDATGSDFTMDVAVGQGMANLVAGARIKPDGGGYTFLGTRGASRISLHDGTINFHTSDATSGTANADAVGLNVGSAKMVLTNTGSVGIGIQIPKAKLQVVGGAIMPEAGNSEAAGLLFPSDPGGGSGDRAWMRYYARPDPRTNEAMTLELGTSNDTDDHIALMPSGNVGIGTITPGAKLDVNGSTNLNGTLSVKGPLTVGSIQIGTFTAAETDEWPNFAWYRDTAANWDEGLIKHGTGRGKFGRAGFGIHMHQSREFGFFSTNWDTLFAVQGATGNTFIKGYLETKQVYFSAYVELNSRSGNLNPLPMQAASQNVGGGYNTSTSKFTAPVKGVYLFTMTAYKAEDAGALHWYLIVSGGYSNSGGNNGDEPSERGLITMSAVGTTSSRTVILALNTGDTVWIQQAGSGRVDNFRSGLEGILISANL